MTPRLLALFFEGKAKAARERRKLTAWAAWHAGVLSQATKPPDLDVFMREEGDDAEPPEPRKKTGTELFALAQRWNEHLGGKVIYRDTP